MKMKRTLFLIVMFAAFVGATQQPAGDPSASVDETPGLLQIIAPVQSQDDIRRINGLSTRSWTTVVGWRPGASAFPSEAAHEPGLYLFSLGVAPER